VAQAFSQKNLLQQGRGEQFAASYNSNSLIGTQPTANGHLETDDHPQLSATGHSEIDHDDEHSSANGHLEVGHVQSFANGHLEVGHVQSFANGQFAIKRCSDVQTDIPSVVWTRELIPYTPSPPENLCVYSDRYTSGTEPPGRMA
jgi:hypothetical protein